MLRPRTRAAITAAREAGLHVLVVTGRMFRSVRPYLAAAGLDEPVVCYQGGVVADPVSGRWLLHEPIPLELAREVIVAVEAEGYPLNCYVDDELYVAKHTADPSATRTSRTSRCTRSATCSTGSTSRRRNSSRSATPSSSTRSRGAGRAFRRPDVHLEVAAVLPRVRSPEVTKGSGLRFLAEHLGFALERTVAFGDGENDIPLLERAGYAVAVANAHEPLLALADLVCPPRRPRRVWRR